MRQKVLIVQTDPKSAQPLVRYFKERGDEVWGAWDLNQAEALFEQVKPDLVYLDLHFPGEDWQDLVRLILERPTIRLVVTNKHPDLQREMQAQSLGVRVFLRQPFRPEWIERSLEKLGESTKTRRRTGAKKPVIRIPVRIKIILPYLVLSILFTLAVIYLISRVVIDSAQERYLNQLVATGKQAT
ncbi:MAG: response regulator transcription factor, partial [Chloroflexi bacterium]|nr:response regulator transcription factor [Chloroflexota bacterium]